MTVQEMLREIGKAFNDPDGDRFDPVYKTEVLDNTQLRLLQLLVGLERIRPLTVSLSGLIASILTVSTATVPIDPLVYVPLPDDFFDFQRNKWGQPIVEIGGKIGRPIRDSALKDALGNSNSTIYASSDSPAFYIENGGVVPFPAGSTVACHYIKQPTKFVKLDINESCELPVNLHPVLVQDAIAQIARDDRRRDVEEGAIKKYFELLRGVVG